MGKRQLAVGGGALGLTLLAGIGIGASGDPAAAPVAALTPAPVTSTVTATVTAVRTVTPTTVSTTSRRPSASPKPKRTTPKPKGTTTTTRSVYFANCSAARAAGAAPLFRGEPGYRSGLDRDGDGVACE